MDDVPLSHNRILDYDSIISFLGSEESDSLSPISIKQALSKLQVLVIKLSRLKEDEKPVLLSLNNSKELLLSIIVCITAKIPFCIISPAITVRFIDQVKSGCLPEILTPVAVIYSKDEINNEIFQDCKFIKISSEVIVLDTNNNVVEELNPFRCSNEVIYYQLTSGSTGEIKAVGITSSMLHDQLCHISNRVNLTSKDRFSFWLPLYHDFGLIILLLSVYNGAFTSLSSPQLFMRRPLSWLDSIKENCATVTATAPFALQLCSKLVRRSKSDLDLSCLKVAFVGGEPIFPSQIDSFYEAYKGVGLSLRAIFPAYGMAESVCGLTMKDNKSNLNVLGLDKSALFSRGEVKVSSNKENSVNIISNGWPLAGIDMDVWCLNIDQVEEPNFTGRIMIKGSMIADRYVGKKSDLILGWRDTGDIGFIYKNEVYIVGRKKDIVIKGGVNIASDNIEDVVKNIDALNLRKVIAFSYLDLTIESEVLVIMCETNFKLSKILPIIAREVRDHCGISPDLVIPVNKGSLPFTTSGKPCRAILRDKLLDGDHSYE